MKNLAKHILSFVLFVLTVGLVNIAGAETNNKAESITWLNLTRERFAGGNVDHHIEYLRGYVEKAGVTLSEIGTSETELANLLKAGYLAEANNWLKLTRERSTGGNAVHLVGYIREYTKKAESKLSDIGTSEEELSGLIKTGYVAEAAKWLKLAREYSKGINANHFVANTKKYADKAGISLQNLRTNDGELNSLSTN